MQKVTVESSVDAAGDHDADDTSHEKIVGKYIYVHMYILLYHKVCVCIYAYVM